METVVDRFFFNEFLKYIVFDFKSLIFNGCD